VVGVLGRSGRGPSESGSLFLGTQSALAIGNQVL
jgi:hypothetical protein